MGIVGRERWWGWRESGRRAGRRQGGSALLVVLLALSLGGCGPFRVPARFPAGMSRSQMPDVFPKGFLLGTATSAYQIEGGNSKSDWWLFEQQPGRIKHGDRSGAAVDGWNRVPGDIALMQSIGANAYRFSIEWSRLEPEEGKFDDAAFAHYLEALKELRAAGITPMVTLLHFTLPEWLAAKGGLLAPEFAERFAIFAQEAVTRLGGEVTLWCTMNEPNVQMFNGYVEGVWPPGERKNKGHAVEAFAALLKGHAAAAGVLHRAQPGAQVGVALHVADFEPKVSWSPLDWYGAGALADAFDWSFYDSIAAGRIRFHATGYPSRDEALAGLKGSADFFGMNYYRRLLAQVDLFAHDHVKLYDGPGPKSDLGWEIHPEGLLQMLREAYGRYKLPIYITENGIADRDGAARVTFLDEHLFAVGMALQEGIPVKGYFHWSLMDNFEWAEGFGPRFGLFQVNSSLARKPGKGAEEFRRLSHQILH